MALKLSIINFKGGVGKTTVAFHLAAHLAASKRVLVVDLDHQSSLSIIILRSQLWEECQKASRTTNRIFEAFCNRKVQPPNAEIIFKNPIGARSPRFNLYPNLDIVPAQFELDDTEIELASTTMGGATVSEWSKRTLLADWLDRVNADSEYDYIIFDCPPATKLVSQNAIAASDYFVVPVIPDDLSLRGVEHFLGLVTNRIDGKLEYLRKAAPIADQDVPRNYVPSTKLAAIVPYMAKTAGNAKSGLTDLHTGHIQRLQAARGEVVLSATVKNWSGVPESLGAGWPVWNRQGVKNTKREVVAAMRAVCEDITHRLIPITP